MAMPIHSDHIRPSLAALGLLLPWFLLSSDARAQQAVEFRFDPSSAQVSIPVKVNGTGPYHFLLDTGIRGAISQELADKLGISVVRKSFAHGRPRGTIGLGRGGVNQAAVFADVGTFEIGPFTFEHPWNLALDLGHLPTHADGLLGFNIMKDLVTTIDYPHGRVRFARRFTPPSGAAVVRFRTAGFLLPGRYVRKRELALVPQ